MKTKKLKKLLGLKNNSPLYQYLLQNQNNFTLAGYVDFLANTDNSLALTHVDKYGVKRNFTYKDLSEESSQMANYLKSKGVKKGDVVALVLRNNYQFYIAILALQKLGCIAMPLQYTNKQEQYESVFRRAKPTCVIADDYEIKQAKDKSVFVLDEISKSCSINMIKICTYKKSQASEYWYDLDEYKKESKDFTNEKVRGKDWGYLFSTSGTTGEPKLPMHNYDFALANYITGLWYGLKKGQKHLTITDSGWAMSSWNMAANLLHQSTLYVEDYNRFNEEELLTNMNKENIKTLCAPRSILIRLIKYLKEHPSFERPKLKTISSAGEKVDDDLRKEVMEVFKLPIKEGYGMTEVVLAFYQEQNGRQSRNPYYKEISIEQLPDTPLGQIVIKTKKGTIGLTRGYLKQNIGNYVLYQGPPKKKGHAIFKTGDGGYVDDSGQIYCEDRLGNTDKVNDCLVNKSDVERTIKKLPFVSECLVESEKDPISGCVLTASIELTDEYVNYPDLEDLKRKVIEFVKTKMNDYCRPKYVVFKKLERTCNGKLKRQNIVAPPDKKLVMRVKPVNVKRD